MAFSDAPSVAYGGAQQQESPNDQESQSRIEKSLEEQLASPLNKQGSIFSLTLDEIQLKSGKSVGSMNMDEFLANLWNNVDENQVTSQPPDNNNNNNNQDNEPIMGNKLVVETVEPAATLTRQNSFSIPILLCKKTVEEVWSEIQKDQQPQRRCHVEPPQRQPTFGEITLEEFLVKAGVVQEPATKPCPQSHSPPIHRSNNDSNNNNNTCLGSAYGMGLGPSACTMMALGFSATQPSMGSNLLVNGYAAYPIYTAPTELVGQLASTDSNNGDDKEKSQGMMLEAVGPKGNRKRIIDGPHEVVVERRQRRMIKNRESAARSRARKQAYTVELELELTQLKAENDKLKEAVKELERKRVQELVMF
ncbi:ABSCISIC ACID-INSENSITIVE 5-like protein 1 isoform X7 [Citrus sinensis]|uniref:ABSCISIC ACID-INSENSITIVE 5-like protein 1 isoform X7 n=1 Tax=Citrus sinensis TaxID=2711 RepID=UPI002278DE38|nr:ABSCISIC ACID-INSENSITIVE 5-like protein 1 isoform X7 [Citrus sinensis]